MDDIFEFVGDGDFPLAATPGTMGRHERNSIAIHVYAGRAILLVSL